MIIKTSCLDERMLEKLISIGPISRVLLQAKTDKFRELHRISLRDGLILFMLNTLI